MNGVGSYSVAHRAGLLPTELTDMWGWILLRSLHQGRGHPQPPPPLSKGLDPSWLSCESGLGMVFFGKVMTVLPPVWPLLPASTGVAAWASPMLRCCCGSLCLPRVRRSNVRFRTREDVASVFSQRGGGVEGG